MKDCILFIIILVLISIIPGVAAYCGPKEFDEYEVKAAFLGNFLKFIDWPKGEREAGDYRICIYGSDPFGQRSDNIHGMRIRGKAVQVKRLGSLRGVNECSMIFISSSERRRLVYVLDAVRDLDVVTVGDTDGYAKQGVMFNFYIEASKVKFEINLATVKRSRVNVSSQLLKLGRMVDYE